MTLDQYPDVGKAADVAAVLDCNIKTVYDLIRSGDLTAIRLGERGLRVTRHHLLTFLQITDTEPDYESGLKVVES